MSKRLIWLPEDAEKDVDLKLLKESAVPYLQYLTEKVARATAKQEDREFFNGKVVTIPTEQA